MPERSFDKFMRKDSLKNIIYFSCIGASVLLIAPSIDSYYYRFLSTKGFCRENVLSRVFGEARKILSMQAYMAGDTYYHGGVSRRFKDECDKVKEAYGEWCPKCEKFTDDPEHEHHDEHETHHECDHGHEVAHEEKGKQIGVSKFNILPYIGELTKIGEHVHLHGEEEKELLPWFYYAVRLDPHNIEAYTIGGYWVASRLDRVDEGIDFLQEGLSNNPGTWQICEQLGRIYFWDKKDHERALENYARAAAFMNEENSDKYDKRLVYFFTGLCYERMGRADKAVEFYRKLLVLFPEDEALRKRITAQSPDN